jgi:hypothetical protein
LSAADRRRHMVVSPLQGLESLGEPVTQGCTSLRCVGPGLAWVGLSGRSADGKSPAVGEATVRGASRPAGHCWASQQWHPSLAGHCWTSRQVHSAQVRGRGQWLPSRR